MNKKIPYFLLALILVTLACGPVIAISWNEFLLIGILFAVLLGPPIYRLIRRVEEFFRRKSRTK
jgi:hypothetical protein